MVPVLQVIWQISRNDLNVHSIISDIILKETNEEAYESGEVYELIQVFFYIYSSMAYIFAILMYTKNNASIKLNRKY